MNNPSLADPAAKSNAGPLPELDAIDACEVLTHWTRRAELGERFDLAGEKADQPGELTRARFDGSSLVLEHWSQGALMSSIELRQAPVGDWRAIPASGGLSGSCAPQSAMTYACDDIGRAFSRLAPTFAIDWTQRLLWAAPWARKKMRTA